MNRVPDFREQRVEEALRASGASLQRPETAATGRADPRVDSMLDRLSRGAGIFAVTVGLLVLAGWALDIALLKSVGPGWVTMKANTALAFVLAGVALWVLQADRNWPSTRVLAGACSAVVAAIGLLTLSQDLASWDLGIDQLLFKEPGFAAEAANPGRMAPTTALNFLLLGGALQLLAYAGPRRLVQPLALTALLVSALAALGYAYDVQSLYRVAPYSSMAIHTSVMFIVLSLAVLCAPGGRNWISIIVSRGAGGAMLRGVWLPSILFLVLLGSLRLLGEKLDFYETEFGLALMVLSAIAVLTVLLWRSAILLDRADAEREYSAEARAQLAAIVETSGDAIVSCAPDGTVLSWNLGAEKILGYYAVEMIGRNVSVIALPDRQHEIQHHVWLLEHGKSVPPFETIRVAKDGRAVDVQMTVSAIPDAVNSVTRIAYIFRDVTERKRAEHESGRRAALTELLERLARAANEATTREAALRACLERICAYGNWTLGRVAILRPSSEAPVIDSSLWHDHDLARFAEFMRVSETYDYARPTGKFISTVLRDKRPMWIEDFQEAEASGRLPTAVKAGLLAGFAFPVIVQGEVAAFLEFFSSEPREPDALLLDAVTAIGSQLARVIERQRALDEARASERKLSGILDTLHEVVWSMDARTGRMLFLNAAGRRLARRPVTDFLAQPRLWRRMIHPDDRAAVRGGVRALLEHDILTHEFRIVLADGEVRVVENQARVVRDEHGKPQRIDGTINDITERKRAEAERAQLAAIVESSQDGIFSRSPDGRILSWNAAAERLYGYTAEEALGNDISFIAPPDRRHEYAKNWQLLGHGQAVPPYETVRVTKDGRRIDVMVSLSPIRNERGEISGVAAITRDITARKRTEAERARLAAIVENSSDAIISRGFDRTILTWNAGAERLFGWSAREAIGQSIYLIVPPERRGENTRYRNLVHKGIPVPTYDTMRLAKDGRRIDVSLSQSAIRNERGEVAAVSLIFRDITERKQAEAERARLAAIVENATDAIIGRSLDGIITSWNAGAERMLGWSAQEAVGRPAAFVIAPENHERVARNNEKVLGGEIVPPHETKRIAKDGRVIDVLSSISPIRDDTGEIVGAANMLQDISALKQAEAALKESEERFRATFEQAGVGMGLRAIDPRNPRWLRVNQKLCEIFGYTEEELLQLTTVDLTPPEDRDAAIGYNEQLLRGEITSYSREKRYVRKDGSMMWTNISLAAVRGPEGRPTHVISVIQDITERKQAEERIGFLAQYDMVTGLPNRQLFSDRLTLAMARDKRLGSMTALLHLDLDRFKQINETLGQSAGDEVLQMVTVRLRDRLREVDTIARLGGDEFAVILEGVTEKGQALRVAEKIMEAMADPLVLKGEELFVTASIGIAVYPADADSMEKLIESAELAMYQAKQEGRNTVQLYTQDRNPRRAAGLGMEGRLRRALERDEFLLHFQPKVDIRTGAITGAEALVRWRNPDLGMVSPADFIPLAEETGLIVPIGEWVLHSACAQASAWHREGHPISMAVNLSARQFRQSNLCETVELALADSALDARRLELEITESMIMHRPEQTIATLQRLHDIGLILSVDDFGTGYSSLSYLKRFPVHKLKIDQSFVRELHKNADDAAIVRAVIALAASLNLKTVAEGVETEQQLIYLAGLHCDEYQGYYFSKPLPAAEFLQLLQARSAAVRAPVTPGRPTAETASAGS